MFDIFLLFDGHIFSVYLLNEKLMNVYIKGMVDVYSEIFAFAITKTL